MELEYNYLWSMLLIAIGIVLISLVILFVLKIAYSQDIETFEDCINMDIQPKLCNSIFPPLDIQAVNYTLVPFP